MRLIDADALKRKAYYATVYDELSCIVDREDIDEAPTIDPVKHGCWKKSGFGWKCSECGARDDEAYFYRNDIGKIQYSDYCRVCGAKMSEEVGKDAN